ncbi:AMP-binding protein [Staphylococcus agnetis]|uniref:class I adenylate-forming enzyme family protein n=1 Tax=Staphylococcus agnetis TaxID=985762 RepID=UPI001430AC02|nr:class I adenylate-forming enzyme family protein [Staphylococcus agnetis]NJH86281.1 AMP-binding protein [Staphylococcus agnetis]NJI15969.1 AMP-binding protein [Staphylococcus agnetis]
MNNLYDILKKQRNNSNILTDGNDSWTYKQIYEYIERKNLTDIIPLENKNIGILMHNSIEFVLAYFLILKHGFTVVPINPNLNLEDLRKELKFCEIKYLFVNDETLDLFYDISENLGCTLLNISNTCNQSLPKTVILVESLNKKGPKKHNVNEVAVLLQTSGTTSNPKKVMLTHKNILSNIKQHLESVKLTHNDKVLIALPMYFGYCLTSQLLSHMYLGSNIHIAKEEIFPKKIVKLINSYNINTLALVPSHLVLLLNYAKKVGVKFCELKFIFFGGGNMPLNELFQLKTLFPNISFIQTYGQTEASPRITTQTSQNISKLASVGKPVNNLSLKVIDKNGHNCPSHCIGEIVIKGANIMKGYYKNPSETNKIIKNDWLYTGDLGYLDNDGYLYIKGRKKNIIISSGINIYPEEIEEYLLNHPRIIDVLVKGQLHNVYGEIVTAFIQSDSLSVENIKSFCKKGLSSYKIPKEIKLVKNIEKTYNGKNKRI